MLKNVNHLNSEDCLKPFHPALSPAVHYDKSDNMKTIFQVTNTRFSIAFSGHNRLLIKQVNQYILGSVLRAKLRSVTFLNCLG